MAWLNIRSILLLGLYLPFFVSSEQIVLDANSDLSKAWLDISCVYNNDYNDFWVFGCPVGLSGDEDVFPQKKGFWSPCTAKKCEIQFYGGDRVPQAKSVTFSMYLRGKPEVLITSKYSPLDEEFSNEVGKISDAGEGWKDVTVDFSDKTRALVLNFTITTESDDDMILVDKITIDLGEGVTTPTEPPAPTTSVPIEDDKVILDKDTDYWLLWDVDCAYVEDYQDFWVFGCEVNPKEERSDTTGGTWNPCTVQSFCRMQYLGNANDSVVDKEAGSLVIHGYLDGDAKINITIQEDQSDLNCDRCKVVEIISATSESDGKFRIDTVDLNLSDEKKHYINIDLMPGNGQVLVQKVEVNLQEPRTVPTTTTPEPTTPQTNPPGTGSTNPGTGSTGTPTESTTASGNYIKWNLLSIFAPILLVNLKVYFN